MGDGCEKNDEVKGEEGDDGRDRERRVEGELV